jgi:hypothetical protein
MLLWRLHATTDRFGAMVDQLATPPARLRAHRWHAGRAISCRLLGAVQLPLFALPSAVRRRSSGATEPATETLE